MELLVVITILGLLAALTVPALKNIGQSQVQVSAARQLLDDVGRARQLAIGQRTTVYMIFVPANFWSPIWGDTAGNFTPAWNNLPYNQKSAVTNLLDKQCTGYNFISLRSVGDQPGQGMTRYLADWKSLPEGAFIAINKFIFNTNIAAYPVNRFNYTNNIPFPTETNYSGISLPYIAFNYLGQLTVDGVNLAPQDEYIPLAQGAVSYPVDAQKNLQPTAATFDENPPGNSANSMFNLVGIDRLTGRATLRQQKIQ